MIHKLRRIVSVYPVLRSVLNRARPTISAAKSCISAITSDVLDVVWMTDEIHSPRSNPHADHVSVLPRQVYIDTRQVTGRAEHKKSEKAEEIGGRAGGSIIAWD